MTHRGRWLMFLTVTLVVAGFALTIANGRGSSGHGSAEAAGLGQPIAAVYVPQPAAVIAGHNVATAAVVHDAAREFVVAYFTFDTKAPLQEYLGNLPRVSGTSKSSIESDATRTWQSVGAGRRTSVIDAGSIKFQDDRSSVDTYTVTAKVQVAVASPGSAASTSPRAVSVTIHREQLGWMVTKVQSVAR